MDTDFQKKKKELEDKLKMLPLEKRKIWRLIAVAVIAPLLGPYFPTKRGFLADRMGYVNAAIMFAVMCVIAVPLACFMHWDKIEGQIAQTEWELEDLVRRNKKKNENPSAPQKR